jgi:hypothetical protein
MRLNATESLEISSLPGLTLALDVLIAEGHRLRRGRHAPDRSDDQEMQQKVQNDDDDRENHEQDDLERCPKGRAPSVVRSPQWCSKASKMRIGIGMPINQSRI